jgi:hypothetical protein
MAQQMSNMQDELEQLRRRFDEFRHTQPLRSRLPEPLWTTAAELATRYGVHPTARALRLDYTGLRRRVEKRLEQKSTPGGRSDVRGVGWTCGGNLDEL